MWCTCTCTICDMLCEHVHVQYEMYMYNMWYEYTIHFVCDCNVYMCIIYYIGTLIDVHVHVCTCII